MNRRDFLKNSIGALLFGALTSNKALASVIENTPSDSLNVLLYLIKNKNGNWKVKATKWTNLNKEKLRYTDYDISTFKALGIYDNSQVMHMQRKYWKEYNCKGKLVPVNHIQCTKNGFNTPVSKVATYKSRSNGGKRNLLNNHIQSLGKKWGAINSLKGGTTQEIRLMGAQAMKEKSSIPIYQMDMDGNIIKEWESMNEAGRNGYNVSQISNICNNKPKFKTHRGYIWKFKFI